MRKLLIGILIIVMLTVVVGAIEPQYIFKQGEYSDLKFSCMDSATGVPCNTLFNCSITIQYPNSSIMVDGVNATRGGAYYNYTLLSTNTLGLYRYQTYCYNGTSGGFSPEQYFLINVLGEQIDTSKAMLYLGGLVVLILFFILGLYGAIKIPYDNKRDERGYIIGMNDLKYLKIFLWFVNYLLLLMIFLMARMVTGFLELDFVTKLFNIGYWTLLVSLFPIFVLFLVQVVLRFFEDTKIEKLSIRNIKIR